MGFAQNHKSCALFLVVILPLSILGYEEQFEKTMAVYYLTQDGLGTPNGACGYGEYGRTVNDGCVAATSTFYNGGASCGACYKVRCKRAECNPDGVVVVVTDQGGAGEADFILSAKAFNKMAQPGFEKQLMAHGKVEIDYHRVPCQYPGKTLTLKVTQNSNYNSYLSFQLLYQAGAADITAVQVYEEETQRWRPCRRAYGAVWDLTNPPKGPLTVRFFVTAGAENVKPRWIVVPTVIPTYWQPGAAYDTEIQLDQY